MDLPDLNSEPMELPDLNFEPEPEPEPENPNPSESESESDQVLRGALNFLRQLSGRGSQDTDLLHYFETALTHKFSNSSTTRTISMDVKPDSLGFRQTMDLLENAVPNMKFGALTANQAIWEATKNAPKIHIIDFGLALGVQWGLFLSQFVAKYPQKPQKIRISGIPASALEEGPAPPFLAESVTEYLYGKARLHDLEFEFVPILTPVEQLSYSSFRVEPNEVVVVNFFFQLHKLLGKYPFGVAAALRLAKSLNPKIVTLVEHEARLNDNVQLMEGLRGGWNYCSASFDSMAAQVQVGRVLSDMEKIKEVWMPPMVNSVVLGRGNWGTMEDHEHWRGEFMEPAGFQMVPLSETAKITADALIDQTNARLLQNNKRYSLIKSDLGFLTLLWNLVPMTTVSTWSMIER